jgi:hypothetical protein
MDDFHGLLHDTGGQKLLSVITTVHHERVGHTFNDGALGLTETLGSITTGSVREEDLATKFDIILPVSY